MAWFKREKKRIDQPTPPDARHLTVGCRFADRCPKVMEKCRRIDPPAFTPVEGRSVACHLYGEV